MLPPAARRTRALSLLLSSLTGAVVVGAVMLTVSMVATTTPDVGHAELAAHKKLLRSKSTTTTSSSTTSTTVAATTTTTAGVASGSGIPAPLFGVTIDNIANVSSIVASLKALPKKPTTRIVFDETMDPSYYASAIAAIHPYSYIMGELLDSQYVSTYTVAQYQARAQSYVNAFGGTVDIWEIGNEVNGEWLGTTADVVAKISAAYDVVKNAGLRAELTLYYNPNCWSKADHEMFTWASANIPQRIRDGLDYTLMSYYEGDCNNYRPSDWTPVFDKLHSLFANSAIGFGEIGMANPVTSATLTKAQSLAAYYYGIRVSTPGYVLGGFWWYFYEDAVPSTKPMWSTIATAWSGW